MEWLVCLVVDKTNKNITRLTAKTRLLYLCIYVCIYVARDHSLSIAIGTAYCMFSILIKLERLYDMAIKKIGEVNLYPMINMSFNHIDETYIDYIIYKYLYLELAVVF